ncbi:MAG: PRC-barrel domain-containing protein [Brooklawnia sp.]|jgi:hypothetical protein
MAEHADDELYKCTVLDASGSRIGGVSQVYLDDATGEPTFVAARVGLFGTKEVLVPLVGAFVSDGLMQVPFLADQVKQGPAPSADRRLTADHEAQVLDYYGLPYTLPLAEPDPPRPPAEPDAPTQDTQPDRQS